MGNLIYKDFLILRKSLYLGLVYIILFMFVLKSNGIYAYTSAVIAITYMFVMSAFAYDDKNKSDVMINSLPVDRKTVVLAKYASIFVYIAAATAAYIIIYNIVSLIDYDAGVYPATLEGFLAALVSVSLMNGVYLPLVFRMGYTKAKITNMLIFFLAFFGMSFLINLIYKSNNTYVKQALEWLNNQSEAVIIIGAFAMAFLILLLSYTISVKLYKRREF
jgi:ABC-2 type transport system permease protein